MALAMGQIRIRRNLLKSFIILTGALVLAPFIPFGRFLASRAAAKTLRQKVGNINEMPPNSRIVFTYPVTGDREKDSDPFRRFVLIRLPDGHLKAYSMVCVHLWCLADYKPEREQIECPCHGSIYDPETGIAFKGPASVQPNKTLPEVKIEVNEDGDIYAVDVIGVVGYGREAAG